MNILIYQSFLIPKFNLIKLIIVIWIICIKAKNKIKHSKIEGKRVYFINKTIIIDNPPKTLKILIKGLSKNLITFKSKIGIFHPLIIPNLIRLKNSLAPLRAPRLILKKTCFFFRYLVNNKNKIPYLTISVSNLNTKI